MSEYKPFPPSAQKLTRLRKLGIVPYSTLFANAACVVGIALGIKLVWNSYGHEFIHWTETMFTIVDPSQTAASSTTANTRTSALQYAMIPALSIITIASVLVFCLGLLQTRVLISFNLIRATPNIKIGITNWKRRLTAAVAVFFLFCGLGEVTFSKGWSGMWEKTADHSALNETTTDASNINMRRNSLFLRLKDTIKTENEKTIVELLQEYRLYWFGILCFFIIIGIVSRLLVSIAFRHDHRMTRAEVEAEAAEDETPEEVRTALQTLT